MKIIAHRRNSIELLINTPKKYGVEVDIRTFNNELILQHDPLKSGEKLEDWLKHFEHQTLILNVKEEGLEEALLCLMRKFKINDFFFLDQSFPFLIKFAKLGERRCALRVSEFESIETALSLSHQIDWIWVDYFTYFPLSRFMAEQLESAGFRLCIVSPELQGFISNVAIPKLASELRQERITPAAICTKEPERWESEGFGI
ncbi:hypothetical protein ICV32_01480 [Polynucleobacter sp. MWH-UH24A]|uniref:hypothetical protein n=1 Tax=Polynucleobacter sp. MWH-UH24A TaxID=2689110 RepID=UPI001BFD4427|nr:hypothetical protein [Polynucleobacter sp. MWH-UH24A]QWD76372.1 hypothetical protein ICV32_01480 [Polynucleobacter sp. MWH-UH24A]